MPQAIVPNKKLISLAALCLSSAAIASSSITNDPYFSVDAISQWPQRVFAGDTGYTVTAVDGSPAIAADSHRSASALFKEIVIDIEATPYLNWSWRTERLPDTTVDETDKNGDDYAARLYVVFKTGVGFWNTASLNYVWSARQQQGNHWSNAYTPKVTMLAIESGKSQLGQWRRYKRNVAADIKRFTGKTVDSIKGVAIMTDSDNSQSSAKAYYGDIWFSAN